MTDPATQAVRPGPRGWRRVTVAVASAGLAAVATISVLPGVGAAERPAAAGYVLSRLADGSPAAWRPCRTVTWAVDLRAAPRGALADVRRALALTGQATGLRFRYAGSLAAIPQRGWLEPGGWPAGRPDVVLAWARPPGAAGPVSDLLNGEGEAGVAGWTAERSGDGQAWIERAFVVLDAERDRHFEPGSRPGRPGLLGGRRPPRVRLLLHELGHALGLGHVHDPDQVMHPTIEAATGSWAPGDLRGLRALLDSAACPFVGQPTNAKAPPAE